MLVMSCQDGRVGRGRVAGDWGGAAALEPMEETIACDRAGDAGLEDVTASPTSR